MSFKFEPSVQDVNKTPDSKNAMPAFPKAAGLNTASLETKPEIGLPTLGSFNGISNAPVTPVTNTGLLEEKVEDKPEITQYETKYNKRFVEEFPDLKSVTLRHDGFAISRGDNNTFNDGYIEYYNIVKKRSAVDIALYGLSDDLSIRGKRSFGSSADGRNYSTNFYNAKSGNILWSVAALINFLRNSISAITTTKVNVDGFTGDVSSMFEFAVYDNQGGTVERYSSIIPSYKGDKRMQSIFTNVPFAYMTLQDCINGTDTNSEISKTLYHWIAVKCFNVPASILELGKEKALFAIGQDPNALNQLNTIAHGIFNDPTKEESMGIIHKLLEVTPTMLPVITPQLLIKE